MSSPARSTTRPAPSRSPTRTTPSPTAWSTRSRAACGSPVAVSWPCGGTRSPAAGRWRRSCVTQPERGPPRPEGVAGHGAARSGMSDETITFLIVGITVAVFVWDRLPVGVVAFGVALSLWATDVLTLDQSLAGFGDPTVIFIASLFIVSEALDSTGITAWAGQQLIAGAAASQTKLMVLMLGTVAGLTALISVNGSVAALLPVIAVTAVRMRLSPSQLLMPLAFGAHAGSLLALTGSPVNVIVSEYAD